MTPAGMSKRVRVFFREDNINLTQALGALRSIKRYYSTIGEQN